MIIHIDTKSLYVALNGTEELTPPFRILYLFILEATRGFNENTTWRDDDIGVDPISLQRLKLGTGTNIKTDHGNEHGQDFVTVTLSAY